MAPNALAAAKDLVNQAPRDTLVKHLTLERDQMLQTLFHPNGGEGLQAFVEKRAPRFR
jgi:enoyl-CoA hydratase/carnithine racemase